jgi:hypothetical protein
MIFILPSIIGYLIGRYLTRFFENQQYTLFIGYIDALIKEVDSDDRDRRNNVLEKLTNIFDKNFASTAEWSDWWRKRRGHSLVGKIWGIPDP